jgi:hypothetical protein
MRHKSGLLLSVTGRDGRLGRPTASRSCLISVLSIRSWRTPRTASSERVERRFAGTQPNNFNFLIVTNLNGNKGNTNLGADSSWNCCFTVVN